MKQFKRIDMDTILIEGVVYSLNPIKKVDIKSQESKLYINSVKVDGVYYYPVNQKK